MSFKIKMNGSLGKRSHSAAEEFIEKYPRFVVAARKKYRMEFMKSSTESVCTDDNHILYFEAFTEEPVILEEDVEILPKFWALAFLQFSLKLITEVLCKAVFTFEELVERNLTKNDNVLFAVKKIGIMRAAKWLLNKEQDPWSYKPGRGPWPSSDEQEIISTVFETFTMVYSQYGSHSVTFESEEINTMDSNMSFEDFNVNKAKEEYWSPSESPSIDPNNKDHIDQAIERMIDNFEYAKAYTRVIQFASFGHTPKLGNSAQTAKALTKMTLPQNTDIFVDAVQFSKGRWAKACLAKNIVGIADTLFRKYYKVDFIDKKKSFKSIDDFCPVKKLAIIRAVAWIKKKNEWTDIYGFDSNIPEHNLFLSPEEIIQIQIAIESKYKDSVSVVQSDFDEIKINSIEDYVHLDSYGNVVLTESVTIMKEVWLTAFQLSKSKDNVRVGKYLFEMLFTREEIKLGGISGINGKQRFSTSKVNAILNAVRILQHIQSPFEIQQLSELPKWSAEEVSMLKLKIFVEHRHYLAQKLNLSDEQMKSNCSDVKIKIEPGSKTATEQDPLIKDNCSIPAEFLIQDTPWRSKQPFQMVSNSPIAGSGSFSKVWKVFHSLYNINYVVKQLYFENGYKNHGRDFTKNIIREARVLQLISHPNIVQYFTSWMENSDVPLVRENNYQESYEVDDKSVDISFFIVMEYCPLTLKTWLESVPQTFNCDQKNLIEMFNQIATGLEVIHKQGIIHRDLKPSNIFLNTRDEDGGKFVVKIGDFGFSINHTNERNEFNYEIPEVIRGESYTANSDVYSLGVVFLEILHSLNNIHNDKSKLNIFHEKIFSKKIIESDDFCMGSFANNLIGQFNAEESKIILEMISEMLNKDPNNRPNVYFISKKLKMLQFGINSKINIAQL